MILPTLYETQKLVLRVSSAEVDISVDIEDVSAANVGDPRTDSGEGIEDSYKTDHVL